MKKTFLSVLAFVLVLATVLTGTVLAADDGTNTSNVGKVFRLSDSADPIVVDGEMDEAYKSAVPLLINYRTSVTEGIYSCGFARFVWSKADNAIYCYVIMNDADVNSPAPGKNPWGGDSVEMFLGLTGKNTQEWDFPGMTGDGVMQRGLQYRIGGVVGEASCMLLEESSAANGDKTYLLNEELGRLQNKDENKLINADRNIFGWEYNATDKTKTGWGHKTHEDGKGYSVEFRIKADGVGVTLADGLNIIFDFMVNDRFAADENGNTTGSTVYYNSTYRNAGAASGGRGDNMMYYDSLTISDETVENSAANKVSEQELTKYGKADPEVPYEKPAEEVERTYTDKKTFNRPVASRSTNGANTTATTKKAATNAPTSSSTNTVSGGGCGSSVAVGTSVAMIALIGATGFFAFRRKDEE